jgi:hypothetical protein
MNNPFDDIIPDKPSFRGNPFDDIIPDGPTTSKEKTKSGAIVQLSRGFAEGLPDVSGIKDIAPSEMLSGVGGAKLILKHGYEPMRKAALSVTEGTPDPSGAGEYIARQGGRAIPTVATLPIASPAGRLTTTAIKTLLGRPLSRVAGSLGTAATMGAYEAGRMGLEGKKLGINDVLSRIGGGVSAGLVFHGGGKVGDTLLKGRGGQIAGGALAGGALGLPSGKPVEEAIIGGGLTAVMGTKGYAKDPKKLAYEATNAYRNILRPTQGEVKNIEIRKGKNIDDYYKLAAEENLEIGSTSDKKLDTVKARETLSSRQERIHDILNKELSSNEEKQFDLLKIGEAAKEEIRKSTKNDTEYKASANEVDEFIADAIEARGRRLSGSELNGFKQGMWSVGYNQLKPTAKKNARKIGFIAKEAIEKSYPESHIKQLNELSGKYATLTDLLENAQGRVIKGGRLGGYFANAIGAVAGSRIPVVGPLAGAYIGGKVSEKIYDPARTSRVASNKMNESMRMTGGEGTVTERILQGLEQKQNRKRMISESPSPERAYPSVDTYEPKVAMLEGPGRLKKDFKTADDILTGAFSKGIRNYESLNDESRFRLLNAYKSITGESIPKGEGNLIQIERVVRAKKNEYRDFGVGAAAKSEVGRNATPLSINKETTVKDIHGDRKTITPEEGIVIEPIMKDGRVIRYQVHDGQTVDVTKGVAQDLINRSGVKETGDFAPELKGVEEVVKGGKSTKDTESEKIKRDQLGGLVDDAQDNYHQSRLEALNHLEKNGMSQVDRINALDSFERPTSYETRSQALSKLKKYAPDFDWVKHLNVTGNLTDARENLENFRNRMSTTKFHQYQLPGGKNYREVLIKTPAEGMSGFRIIKYDSIDRMFRAYDKNGNVVGEAKTQDELKGDVATKAGNFKSSHWEEPNVLAHLRMNDRTTPDGKKVLFIEELQSDWAREGRDKGFAKGANKPSYEEIEKVANDNGIYFNTLASGKVVLANKDSVSLGKAVYDSKQEALDKYFKGYPERFGGAQGVPPHPLLKNWQELALKRAVKEAVEGGYDYISWTTGEQQAERYDLSKQIKDIGWQKNEDGTFNITPRLPDGSAMPVRSVNELHHQRPEKLASIIGKEPADKIINLQGKEWQGGKVIQGTLKNADLKIGGEWAKNLYDRQVPNILKDLMGGEIENINLGKFSDNEGVYYKNLKQPKIHTQSAIKITPELKKRVMGN